MAYQPIYCETCKCERPIIIKERPANYTFRKEPFDIIERYAECTVCHDDVYHEETANETLQQLSNLYQSKHSITVEDIKKIRNSTGLTQTQFAKILNMGEATIKRYESGVSLPDGTQLGILKMIKSNPSILINFYEEVKDKLIETDRNQIGDKIQFLALNTLEKSTYEILHLLYSKFENKVDNGCSQFQPEKLFNMIIFFAQEGVLKTKLMKLLWYADFLMYKRNKKSISGTPYWHMEFGPVPIEHDTVLGCGTGLNMYSIEEEENVYGYTKMIIKSNISFNPNVFNVDEMSVLCYIKEFFHSYGSGAISDYSHVEEGWAQTKNEQLIPYSYAFSLSLN